MNKQYNALQKSCGTLNNHPPEWFVKGHVTGYELDRWCAGLVLFFMIEGRPAFSNPEEVVSSNLKITNKEVSENYKKFIHQLLSKEKIYRFHNALKCDGVEEHPWIVKI